MYKIGRLIISNKSISKVGSALNLCPYFQSFRYRFFSSQGSDYPPVDYNGFGQSNFQNNIDRFSEFNHLNDSGHFSGNPNGFHDFPHQNFDFPNRFANRRKSSENLRQNINDYHGNNRYNVGSVEGSPIGGQFRHVNTFPNPGGDSDGFMVGSHNSVNDLRNHHKGSRIGRFFKHFNSNIYPNSNHIGPNAENYSNGFRRRNAIGVGDANIVYSGRVNSWNGFANRGNNYTHPNPQYMHNGGSRMDGQLNLFNRYEMHPNSNHIEPVTGRYSNGFQRSNSINGVNNFWGRRGDEDVFHRGSFDLPHECVNDWRSYENMQQTVNQYHGNYHHNRGSQFNCFNNFQHLGGGSNGFEMEPNNNAYSWRNMLNMHNYENRYKGNNQISNFRGVGPFNGYEIWRDGGNEVYQGRSSPNLEYNGPNRGLYSLQQDAYQRYRQASNLGATKTFGRESRFSSNFNQLNDFQGVGYNPGMTSHYTNANGYYYQDRFGKLSTGLQQNSNGYNQQFSPYGFHGGNSFGHKSIVNNSVAGDSTRYIHWNNNQNIGANQSISYATNPESMHNGIYGYQKNNYGEVQRNISGFNMYDATNLSNGYPLMNFGQVQQSNSKGFISEYPYNHQQYNFPVTEMFINNRPQNNNRHVDKKFVVDDGYPCDRQSDFFRENGITLDQQPSKYYNPSLELADQRLNYDNSSETKEIISYKECTYKLHVFCEDGKVKEAVAILGLFEKLGMDIDLSLYLKLVQVCGKTKSLDSSKMVHNHLLCTLDDIPVSVYNEILDMYSKCGSMTDAINLFHEMLEKNNATWGTVLRGLANNGLGEEAIDLFKEFTKTGLKPDGSLFNALFYTCGVLSAVDQGLLYFKSMRVDYGVSPVMENYASIVDMLGRSGHLDEAFEFIESMPIVPSVDIWSTLLNYCRINGYIDLRNRCAEIVKVYIPSELTYEGGMGLLEPESLEVIKDNGTMPNNDFEYHNHRTYKYVAGRANDHVMDEHLRCLAQHMKEAGHAPDITCTLHDIDPENREEGLMFHSERIALIHAAMTSPARRDIRVIKNLRVCRDCHNAMKIASKLTGRLIITRDAKRFHHFKDGKCSCNDFW